jgi:putative protease
MGDKMAERADYAAHGSPELLSPAGDMERLVMALDYGADAVYLAGGRFGMRAASGNFSGDELQKAINLSHKQGVRVYIACNTVMTNDDVRALPQFLESLASYGADAVIVADIGAMTLAKKYAPNVKLHVSTQAGITNYESAMAFYDMGASRAVLARELTLANIAEIREKTPPALELEAFVHGAMCVSFSGRCLLSNYMTGRDANRGECAQPCRWKYHLVEEKRPGEYYEISEDAGTYIFNSRDLCMIGHLPELIGAGIGSLKIEGRMKSAYYVAVVTNAYRHVLDAVKRGEAPSPVWLSEVNKVSHREYSTGFYFQPEGPGQFYNDAMYTSDCDIAAVVERCDDDGCALLTQRNKFCKGDRLDLLTPEREPVPFIAESIRNAAGEEIDATPHPMMELYMKLPVKAPKNAIVRRIR